VLMVSVASAFPQVTRACRRTMCGSVRLFSTWLMTPGRPLRRDCG
jgi:hypothetical protein